MNAKTFDALREQVRGEVITPEDADYDSARAVHNGMIDKRPAAVVRVSQVADVIAAVNHARDNGLDLAVRGGGHSAPGFGTWDDALVIDFANRIGVRVDPKAKTARSEAGATWGDFNHATHAFGLATTGGIVGTTGVSGLTLGGGIGYLSRKYGLSCDNLLSADVVTAEGKVLVASETENEDLFWALRGGGGNFGVVTSLEFKLHPVDMVHVGAGSVGEEHHRRCWVARRPNRRRAAVAVGANQALNARLQEVREVAADRRPGDDGRVQTEVDQHAERQDGGRHGLGTLGGNPLSDRQRRQCPDTLIDRASGT